MGAQTSHIISDNISETSLSSALSGLTYQSCSETSYADTLSTSISEREIVSTPNLQGFSSNDLKNAIRSSRFDSLVGEGGFGSSARSSLIARSSSETSFAESYSTSIFEGGKFSAPKPKAFQLNELKEEIREIIDNISETSLSSARSSLTYPSCSETSYADSLSTSISEREIVSTPNLQGFSFNDLKNAIRSHRFDSLVGEGGFGSSARSSLIARSSSETSDAESYSTSIFEGEILLAPKPKPFSFTELRNATRNFCPHSFLGEGRDGILFKGWIDEITLAATMPGSGMVVAIKNLKPGGFQGLKELLVNYLGQLHHPNLVKLIGYCLDDYHRLLVYEFMPNGSLENHLLRGIQSLSWEMRIKVAIGAARGLFFLHEAKTIHGNFKASNILLDAEFGVKLSDFISKAHYTNICTQDCYLLDTPGGCAHHMQFLYHVIAPEFFVTGMPTAKSDVYSFGVVLLELLAGLHALDISRANGQHNLVEWAKPFLGNRCKLLQIMDTELEGQYPQKGAYMAATLALQCLSTEAKVRPRMANVLATLEQLEAPKIAAKHSPYEQQTISSSVRKPPLRQRHSPMNLTPSASPLPVPLPLPPHGRSTHVH